MINIAQSKGVYDVIKKADLMKALPFDNKSYDLLVTAAVTTYLGNWMKYIIISYILTSWYVKYFIPINFAYVLLEPSALDNWITLVKKGGVLCIVHKSAVWPKWEAKQEKLVADKVWEKVWINKDPVSPVENVALS